MNEDAIGTALHELVADPPRDVTMSRLAALRESRRRRALVTATAVLAALAVAGPPVALEIRRAASVVQTAVAPLHRVTDRVGPVKVTHPTAWAYRKTDLEPEQGYLSTTPMPDRLCRTYGLPGSDSVTCGSPRVALGSDGAVVNIYRGSDGGGLGTPVGGTPTTVGGRPARTIVYPSPIGCGAGADLRILTVVEWRVSGPQDVVVVDACLAGPHLDRARAELAALTASVRVP